MTETGLPKSMVFAAQNRQDADCGLPPAVIRRKDDAAYHGYFENQQGEQFVVRIDRATGVGVLRGGRLGWDNALAIIGDDLIGEAVLAPEELAWLRACWAAATGQELQCVFGEAEDYSLVPA